MKKITLILLAFALVLGFASCKSAKEPTTEPTKQTTTKVVTTTEQTTQTTTKEKTTKKKEDISFIYKGYWYRVESTKVVAIKFNKNGSAEINYFRIKNLKNGNITEKTANAGKFTVSDNNIKLVNTDLAVESDEYELYLAKNSALTYLKDDPEGASEIQMTNNSTLSPEFALSLVESDQG